MRIREIISNFPMALFILGLFLLPVDSMQARPQNNPSAWPVIKNYIAMVKTTDIFFVEVNKPEQTEQYSLSVNIFGAGSITLDPSGGIYEEEIGRAHV